MMTFCDCADLYCVVDDRSDAIWISPMLLNLNDDYHGYAFLDLYQVNDHFGSENDLKSLISAAHARDIWIMLDVVSLSSIYLTDHSACISCALILIYYLHRCHYRLETTWLLWICRLNW